MVGLRVGWRWRDPGNLITWKPDHLEPSEAKSTVDDLEDQTPLSTQPAAKMYAVDSKVPFLDWKCNACNSLCTSQKRPSRTQTANTACA